MFIVPRLITAACQILDASETLQTAGITEHAFRNGRYQIQLAKATNRVNLNAANVSHA
jgi:hypothetical protein